MGGSQSPQPSERTSVSNACPPNHPLDHGKTPWREQAMADDGTKTVPAPGNPARNDQAIRVTRINRSSLSGAAQGSTFEASVRNSVEPVVAQ
jgi:hypothetical protein